MPNSDLTNAQQTKELLISVLSSVGGDPNLSDAQLKLFSLHKNYITDSSIDAKQAQEKPSLNEQKITLSLVLESLREARATSCSQLKAEQSFVEKIIGINVFDDTIGAALTNGVLALFPTSCIFAGLGFVATDDLGYGVVDRNYQPLVPGQRSGDINDAVLYVQHADRRKVFDVGIGRIPVTLGNYDKLKTEYYAQFLDEIQEEIEPYVFTKIDKQQLTAQDLEDLTNLKKLLELSSPESNNSEKINSLTEFLCKKKSEFESKFENDTIENDTKIKESDIFFIEKFLSGEMVFNKTVTLGSILIKVNDYKSSGSFTFTDQQMARIKYEILDKKHNENRTEQLKTETLNALKNAESIAKTRQENFLTKLQSLSFDECENSTDKCKNSTDFYKKLGSEDSLQNYKDLFNECEHWASHHPKCNDNLKTFLEDVAKNKKQTTNYLLTKDRTLQEKGLDVLNFYKSIASLGGIFAGLKKLDLEHHFAEWGREAATFFYNTNAGQFIANSQFAHDVTHLAGTVGSHVSSVAGAVVNSAPAHAVTTGVNAFAHSPLVIAATQGVAGLAGFIKSIPILPVVAAGVGGFLATGVYLRGMDYPEPNNIKLAPPAPSITNGEGESFSSGYIQEID